MRRAILCAVLIVLVFPLSRSAIAQTGSKCDPTSVFKFASSLHSSGNNKSDMLALYKLAQQITDMDIACNGMVFKGTGDKVLDPITMQKGYYKVTAQTSGFFALDYKIVSGDCDVPMIPYIFNQSPSDIMNPKAETHEATLDITAEDCRYVFKTSNTQGKDWILTFDLIE